LTKEAGERMVIVIVDNGKNAEKIAKLVPNAKIIKPDVKELKKIKKPDAFILSDGEPNNKNKNFCIKLFETSKRPILAIGLGYLYLGAIFGCNIKEVKPTKKKNIIRVKHGCPIVVDMKRVAVVQDYRFVIDEIPEDNGLEAIAESPECKYEIIQDMVNPFFGVHFNPELGGDGKKILNNFMKFVEVFDKYHK